MKQRWNIFLIAAAMLSGCGSPSTTSPSAAAFEATRSWIRHDVKHSPLIYASGALQAVLIYNYSGQQVGQLGGLWEPAGLCSDSAGDVFVPSRSLVYEYPAGGSLPVNILDDRPYGPIDCAVDPTTGNVAVVNGGTGSNVAIFPAGSTSNPTLYTAPNISTYEFCAYDPAGNLYADGVGLKESFQLAALDKGSDSFVAVPFSGLNNEKHIAAGIQWDGEYVAVGDGKSGVIYRLTISGSSGRVVQRIKVQGWRQFVPEFAIIGKRLLLPKSDRLLFYSYPAGGKYRNGFLGSLGHYITVTNPK
jgi:hypothetical protein